jgi:hypothetical protein
VWAAVIPLESANYLPNRISQISQRQSDSLEYSFQRFRVQDLGWQIPKFVELTNWPEEINQ